MPITLPFAGLGIIMTSAPNYKKFFQEEEGIPRKYWGEKAAGCIIISKDTGRILLAKRGVEAEEPGTWGTWGGKLDAGENAKQAVSREVEEETGYEVIKVQPLYVFRDGDFEYHNFLVVVPFEFTPKLNWENDDSMWVEYGKWPSNLHFGFEALILNSGHKIRKVIDLIKKKKDTTTAPKKKLNEDMITLDREGLVDVGTYGFKMSSSYGFLLYGHDPISKVFYLYRVVVPRESDQNQGHSKKLLEYFFQIVKQNGGAVEPGSYTTSGMAWTKHVVERLAQQYNVPLI